jgi:hypothetical protein
MTLRRGWAWGVVAVVLSLSACSSESTNVGSGGAGTGGTATGGAGGATGGTSGAGGGAGAGGSTGGSGGASGGAGGTGGASGGAGGTGGASGGAGGTGGASSCGNGVCDSGEMLTCVGDCSKWYYVTNATNPNGTTSTDPQTWRGDLTFTSSTALTLAFTHTSGNTATETNHTYTLASNHAISTNGSATGQMSPAADFFALAGMTAPLQVLAVRKGSGLSKASIAGTYRVRGLQGKKSDKSLNGLSAQLVLDANGCISSGSGQRTDGTTPVALTFVKAPGTSGTGCATVTADGKINLAHQQQSGAGTQPVTYEGWVGSGGNVILWTRNESTGFEPGVILAVREVAGHGVAKVKGTYGVTHLVGLNSVRGDIALNNGAVTGGTLAIIGQTGITVTGDGYQVAANGNMATTVKDTVSPSGGFQAGQASNFGAAGLSPILVTAVAASYNTNAPSNKPSLMVWVLRK